MSEKIFFTSGISCILLLSAIPQVNIVPCYIFSFILFLLPGLFVSGKLSKYGVYDKHLASLMAFGFSAMIGYFGFWIYFMDSNIGKIFSILNLLFSFYILIIQKHRKEIFSILFSFDMFYPVIIMFITGILYISFLYSLEPEKLLTAAMFRFRDLPSDNLIPYNFLITYETQPCFSCPNIKVSD